MTCPGKETPIWRRHFPTRISQAQHVAIFLCFTCHWLTSFSFPHDYTIQGWKGRCWQRCHSGCVLVSVCTDFDGVLLWALGSYQKKPALTASPSRQESCPDCRNKMCSNIEWEKIQQAVLSRLLLSGPDSMVGPLESCPVCLYLGRECQYQGQLLSKISKFPASGRVSMLLGPRTGGSANGTASNISINPSFRTQRRVRCRTATCSLGLGRHVQTEVSPDMSHLLVASHIRIPPPTGPPCPWQKLARSFFVLAVIIWSWRDWENALAFLPISGHQTVSVQRCRVELWALSDVHKEFSSFFKSTSLRWKNVWVVAHKNTKVSKKVCKRCEFHLLTHCLFLLKLSSKLFKICCWPKSSV